MAEENDPDWERKTRLMQYQHELDVALENRKEQVALILASYNSTIQFAINAIRGGFIANGAAIIALLTFVGNSKMDAQPLSLSAAALLFLGGVAAATIAGGFTYLSQARYTYDESEKGDNFRRLAIGFSVTSIVTFIAGALAAALAIL